MSQGEAGVRARSRLQRADLEKKSLEGGTTGGEEGKRRRSSDPDCNDEDGMHVGS